MSETPPLECIEDRIAVLRVQLRSATIVSENRDMITSELDRLVLYQSTVTPAMITTRMDELLAREQDDPASSSSRFQYWDMTTRLKKLQAWKDKLTASIRHYRYVDDDDDTESERKEAENRQKVAALRRDYKRLETMLSLVRGMPLTPSVVLCLHKLQASMTLLAYRIRNL
jgi:hypothetical protein